MPVLPKPEPAADDAKPNSAPSASVEKVKVSSNSALKIKASFGTASMSASPEAAQEAGETANYASAYPSDAENRPADEEHAEAADHAIEEAPKLDLSQLSTPAPEDVTKLLKSWVDEVAGMSKNAQGFTKSDEVILSACKELLRSSYSTAKGSELLSSLQVEPAWLTGLMTDAVWRTTLVDLARSAPKEVSLIEL
jgi:hypothetical protein